MYNYIQRLNEYKYQNYKSCGVEQIASIRRVRHDDSDTINRTSVLEK